MNEKMKIKEEIKKKIDELITEEMTRYGTPGVSIGIIHFDRLI